jgi:hypothetical protein
MPRLRVIILERDGDDFRFAMWADVPVARQTRYADANKVSAWKDATTQDNTDLKGGVIVEQVQDQRVPSGASTADIQVYLQTQWSAYQNYINSFNPWQRYGSSWDGTTWAMVNNG